MRARNVKPRFLSNADLLELPYEARLLFLGLWMMADREGRLEDRPKQIKIDVFPGDNVDVDDMLNRLAASGMVLRYQVDGGRFLQVVNFLKHQNPHRDERASLIPPPSGHSASTVQAPCQPDGDTVQNGLIPDSLIPDSRFPDREAHAQPDPARAPPDDADAAPDGAVRAEPDAASQAPPTTEQPEQPEQPSPDRPRTAAAPPPGPVPTPAAVACRAMRAAGLASVNPSSPVLAELLAAGADEAAFVAAAQHAAALGKGFAYALGTVRVQMADAARAAAGVRGVAGGAPPARASPPEPAWRTEQRQRTLQAVPGIAAKPLAPLPKYLIETGAQNVVAIAVG